MTTAIKKMAQYEKRLNHNSTKNHDDIRTDFLMTELSLDCNDDEQDFEAGTTKFIFNDGSFVLVCGDDFEIGADK